LFSGIVTRRGGVPQVNSSFQFDADGVSDLQVLWEDGERVLCRGWCLGDDGSRSAAQAVLLAAERQSPAALDRLAHENELRDALDAAWAARPLALSHKDVKPANILANCPDGRTRLTGFGIASRLPRERQAPEPPEVIAGTLAYMAPEQTGRMNRSIDSRSDLYALGVMFYQMLAGRLPFSAADPMEWVHCHIARKPAAPAERLESVPAPISEIVMKLLAKTAEDRYQTAAKNGSGSCPNSDHYSGFSSAAFCQPLRRLAQNGLPWPISSGHPTRSSKMARLAVSMPWCWTR
jgi:serine/threonine protein kinase